MNLSKYKRIVFSLVAGGLLLVGLFLLLNGTPQIARADPGDLFVMIGGSGDCSQPSPCDLQTALSTATDGDTLYLAEGTYTGSGGAVLTVTHSITLYGGWDGTTTTPPVRDPEAYPTILDGEGQRRVIHLDGDLGPITPTIDGFVIVNGNAANAPENSGRGGGIYSINATPLIAHNVISNNVAGPSATDGRGYGGGVYLYSADGTVVITANQVLSNAANIEGRGYGGGIYLSSAPAAQVVNNVVLSNTASITGGLGYGGGMAFSYSDGTLVTGNRVEHNVAQGGSAMQWGSHGGGVYCSSSDDVFIGDNLIRYNIASVPANGSGGGIDLWVCDRVTIAGNTLQENWGSIGSANGYGGGLSTYAARDLTINANRIVSNTTSISPWGWGGGLYLARNTTFTMTNNIVAGNGANRDGGGVSFETGGGSEPVTGTLAHNTFVANDSGSGNGRIAIHLNNPYVTLVLTNNLIYSHTYGVYVTASSTATLYNTLFYAHSDGDIGGPGAIVNTNPITGQDPLLDADYHLQGGSPAIDAGLSLPWLTTDIDSDPRPQGSGYDIGADEFRQWYICLPLVEKNYP